MPSAAITIKGVAPKKSGATNGRNWTLYEVDAGEKTFSTLDGAWSLFVGDTLTVEYEILRNGSYTNYRLGEAPTKPAAVQAPASADKFSVLNEKLERILAILGRHFAS